MWRLLVCLCLPADEVPPAKDMTMWQRITAFLIIAAFLSMFVALVAGCGGKGFEDDGPDPIEQTSDPTTRPIGMSADGNFDAREALHDPRVDNALVGLGVGVPSLALIVFARWMFPRKQKPSTQGGPIDPRPVGEVDQ